MGMHSCPYPGTSGLNNKACRLQALVIKPLVSTGPAICAGVDVVCKAKTGTGKTLAFLIPALEQLAANRLAKGRTGVLIISPTRELASQIAEEAKQLSQFHNFVVQVSFEGPSHLSRGASFAPLWCG